MTQQDARERAWAEFKAEIEADYSYPLPFGFEQTWMHAWDAAKREDEQRIAALVAAAHGVMKSVEAYVAVGNEAEGGDKPKPEDQWDEYDYMVIPAWRALDAALRALAGQTEVTG